MGKEKAVERVAATGIGEHERQSRSPERNGGQKGNHLKYPSAYAYGTGAYPHLSGLGILQLQRTVGNRAVGMMLQRGRSARPEKPAPRGNRSFIQRMIDSDVPATTDWGALEKYVFRTLINPRKQTFEQSVVEHIETRAAGYAEISSAWEQVKTGLKSKTDIGEVASKLTDIRTRINDVKSLVPDHPNKRGIDASQELYETIPQSENSKTVAATIRQALLNDFTANVQYKIIRPKSGPAKVVPDRYGGAPIVGKWSESFMLGVLVLPNGDIHVSHSGFMGPTQNQAFVQIVQTNHGTPVTHDTSTDHDDLTRTFTAILQREIPKHAHHKTVKDKGRDKVQHDHPTSRAKLESGNPVGTCAAPQALHDFNDPNLSDFPAELTGNSVMGMTEVLVRYETKINVRMTKGPDKKYWGNVNPVQVLDANDAPQSYSGSQDVVSCLTCQFQLRETLKRIVDRRRNVLNKETIEKLEKASGRYGLLETAEQLIEDLANGGKRDTFVNTFGPGVGKDDSEDTGSETAELRGAADAYKKAIEGLAKQQTMQPEHIEWDRGSEPNRAATDFKDLTGKEKSVRREQAKLALGRRKLVGKQLDGDKYADAMESRRKELEEASDKIREKKNAPPELMDTITEAERAEQALAELRVQRILGIGNTDVLAGQIQECLDQFSNAAKKLIKLSREEAGEAERLNAELAGIAKKLRLLVQKVPDRREVYAPIKEERARKAEDEAIKASGARDAKSDSSALEAERQEFNLRKGAEDNAGQAREKREKKALEEAKRLESLAGDIARMYDMSLGAAIVYLASRMQAVPDDSPNPMEHAYS
ncbi:hypothetical protein FE783_26765 [Paenibacillus mesophilus]|uniref:hypothetical protein n=1 Tax=Paenibacillus mesophilus TaxID=2582849 RepID=UPI00110EAB44|nr:hypothetical protein [Paenibacillus mesophilus]TMV46294.1 hypothetical protein FE783_26765 [Paenibacillus mesophilus]